MSDDNYSKESGSNWCRSCGLVPCLMGIFLLAMGAGLLTYIVYLGVFAFANPDQVAWYGLVSDQGYLFTS